MQFLPFMVLAAFFACNAYADITVETGSFTARFERGALVHLRDSADNVMVENRGGVRGGGIFRMGAGHWPETSTVTRPFSSNSGALEQCAVLAGLPGGALEMNYDVDEITGDLIITQHGKSPEGGVNAVRWSIERIPLDWRLIVPGHSGLCMTAETPGDNFTFDYPMTWQAQLLIVEGDTGGFYVWADDPVGRFKRLVIERGEDGWRVGFDTHPLAPFENKTECESVVWRLNVYRGDWRAPAKRYRDWAEKHFAPVPLDQQQPDWVKDIRACVIMPTNAAWLEPLARHTAPQHTLIYIYNWRADGYDRNYPDYEAVFDFFPPFMEKAKALGFRVMLHVNYFGCDPLHPFYEQFEPYHSRVPHGQNNKDWWHYPAVEPPIKFAYINPAAAAWRREIVERFAQLCADYDVDALHLDQTLVIYNDYNGLIDGMTMLEGNIALHRELRAAMPHVALSGEGLNEATYRHEAFAQLHVYGIDHAGNTAHPDSVAMAHPISAYLLHPYTRPYGYLGMAPPENAPLYAAWLEAYRRWGVIPTLKLTAMPPETPEGFTRLLFDEMRLWMEHGLTPDMDAPWPKHIAMPLRTAAGEQAAYTLDGALLLGDKEKQRIISNTREINLPGVIPGWRAYTDTRIIGLDPDKCYPYLPEPRDNNALRLTALPDGATLSGLLENENLAYVHLCPLVSADIFLAPLLADATTGARPVSGDGYEQTGPLTGDDGAMFIAYGDALHAHPPWQAPGSGDAFARFTLQLPKAARRFVADVALSPFAVGEPGSDGVLFGVRIAADDGEARQEVFTKSARKEILELAVDDFTGRQADLELYVGAGPAGNPSYDWARWFAPRIECDAQFAGEICLAGAAGWRTAVGPAGEAPLDPIREEILLKARIPGAVYLLRERTPEISPPVSLVGLPFVTAYHLPGYITGEAPQHACAVIETNSVGGVSREGFFAHPPNEGMTVMLFPITLGNNPAAFQTYVGLRDGADKSNGVVFSITINGSEVARQRMTTGPWRELFVDLTPWAGQTIVLGLVTDADGDHICDWACWGNPLIAAR